MALRTRRASQAEASRNEHKEIKKAEKPPTEAKLLFSNKTLGGAAGALSVLSAASGWNVAKQYEKNIWDPLFAMVVQYAITLLLALAVALSPSGRSLKPGGPPLRDGKKSLSGGGLILVALWLGFGFLGPCGVITGACAMAAILLSLP